ncbi:MAG: hypothetical protein QM775_33250 [Pirellulales bacterium]
MTKAQATNPKHAHRWNLAIGHLWFPRSGLMHTVELLEAAIASVKKLGYRVRTEVLDDGTAGGVCTFGGRRWIFLDARQKPIEHLHEMLEVLRGHVGDPRLQPPAELARLIELPQRRAA